MSTWGSACAKSGSLSSSRLSPPVSDHLLELLMMVDAARHASARRIHAVIPYYSYARSDKKDEPRISITARLVADLLRTAGASHVITMTLHSPQVHGFFPMPVDHLTSQSVFINHFRKQDLSNTVVVSPDIGHAKRAAKLARALGVPLAAANKERLTEEHVSVEAIDRRRPGQGRDHSRRRDRHRRLGGRGDRNAAVPGRRADHGGVHARRV